MNFREESEISQLYFKTTQKISDISKKCLDEDAGFIYNGVQIDFKEVFVSNYVDIDVYKKCVSYLMMGLQNDICGKSREFSRHYPCTLFNNTDYIDTLPKSETGLVEQNLIRDTANTFVHNASANKTNVETLISNI